MKNLLDLKSFLKFLSKNKAYTLIDIFGLSISLMFVILISIFTVQEISVDKFHEHADRIYVLGNENRTSSAIPIAYHLRERYPEIEKVCPVIINNFQGRVLWAGDKKMQANLCFADSSFFNFFSFGLISGDRNQVLKDRNSAVISETYARKLFGSKNPVGQKIRFSNSVEVTVTGIMEDFRRSVISPHDLLLRIELAGDFNYTMEFSGTGNAGSTTAFLLAKPNTDLRARTEDIHSFLKEIFWPYQREMWKGVSITPLKELYFSDIKSSGNSGNKRFVLVLMSVGILILIFAVFNYINLTVAQAGQRAKEMATRRLLGSSRGELFMRLIAESTLLTFISFCLGLALAEVVVPFADDLLHTHIELAILRSPVWIAAGVGIILLIGCLSGLLPAILISGAKPINVVRGTFRRQTKMVFSKCFITFQNAITIIMVTASIVMILQINHLIHAPLGYNTSNILETNNPFMNTSEQTEALFELQQKPFVKRIGFASGMPFSGSNNMSGTYEGRSLSFQQFIMDSTTFSMLELEIIRENNPDPSGWYLTEKAMRDMELPEDASTFMWGKNPVPIAGIIRDFQQRGNITTEKQPSMLSIRKPENMHPWTIQIETTGNPYSAFEEIRKVYERVSGINFEARYIDEQIRQSFESQRQLAKIVTIFASIAILISILGLLAMSTYSSNNVPWKSPYAKYSALPTKPFYSD